MQLVHVRPLIVVVSVFVLLPSSDSAKALAGSIVADRTRSGAGIGCTSTTSLTVIVVSPPAGRSPEQSRTFATGPLQLKPFEPSALRNVADVADGSVTDMWTPLAAAVPPFTATMVYLRPCPGMTGSGLSVIEPITRSKAEPPVNVLAVAVLSG